jgi:hypothetical protein
VKKLLALAGIVVVVGMVVYRERLFVLDPLAKISRNGVAQHGVHVFINHANDVLVEDDEAEAPRYLVQHGNLLPGVPAALTCLYGMACITEADRATAAPIAAPHGQDARVAMSDKQVRFVDRAGAVVTIALW